MEKTMVFGWLDDWTCSPETTCSTSHGWTLLASPRKKNIRMVHGWLDGGDLIWGLRCYWTQRFIKHQATMSCHLPLSEVSFPRGQDRSSTHLDLSRAFGKRLIFMFPTKADMATRFSHLFLLADLLDFGDQGRSPWMKELRLRLYGFDARWNHPNKGQGCFIQIWLIWSYISYTYHIHIIYISYTYHIHIIYISYTLRCHQTWLGNHRTMPGTFSPWVDIYGSSHHHFFVYP